MKFCRILSPSAFAAQITKTLTIKACISQVVSLTAISSQSRFQKERQCLAEAERWSKWTTIWVPPPQLQSHKLKLWLLMVFEIITRQYDLSSNFSVKCACRCWPNVRVTSVGNPRISWDRPYPESEFAISASFEASDEKFLWQLQNLESEKDR